MNEPTQIEMASMLTEWGCTIIDSGEEEWLIQSPAGGQTTLEADNYDDAVFEAWHLMKP